MKYGTKRNLIKCKTINEKINLNKTLNGSIICILAILGVFNWIKFNFWDYFTYTLNTMSIYFILLLVLAVESFLITKYGKRTIFNRIFNNFLQLPAIGFLAYFVAISLDLLARDHKSILSSSHTFLLYSMCAIIYISVSALLYFMLSTIDKDNTKTIKESIKKTRYAKLITEASSVGYYHFSFTNSIKKEQIN